MPEEPTDDPVSLAIRAYADLVVARAPKFTDAQIARLRVLLRPAAQPTTQPTKRSA